MKEAPENGKDLSHSEHANGMNEQMNKQSIAWYRLKQGHTTARTPSNLINC
jgi:hypothetical protein